MTTNGTFRDGDRLASFTIPAGPNTDHIQKVAMVDDTGAALSSGLVAGGDASAANQATQITAMGGITETAPASDTASSGLNGRLQRIAQRITSLIALLPASLGGKAPSASLSVTPALLSCATVAAGSTTTAFGATGAAGDYMSHVILEPAAVGAGTTTIFNNATEVYKYTAGTLADLRPILVPLNMASSGGAWKATTGANMQVRGFGTFTA